MVSLHDFGIAGRSARFLAAGAYARSRGLVWRRWCWSVARLGGTACRSWRRRGRPIVTAVLLAAIVSSRGFVTDEVVGDAATFGVRNGFVVVVALWVAGDDVPGVQEAREVAQDAEEDVDQGVARTDARFDPDCETQGMLAR